MNNKAIIFNEKNLKKKFFMMLKFNSFCKKEFSNINNEINFESKDNINNDSINSDIFNFFHGDKERPNIAIQTKNIFDINEHNNSIKLNEVNNLVINEEKKNYDEDKNSKIDYTKDKNYNDALKLRQILETKKDSTEEETNEQNKLNLQQSKNEVDELLNNLKSLYKEIDSKTIKTNKSNKSNK